jgi:DNA-binding LytR/AlgR family response regulator
MGYELPPQPKEERSEYIGIYVSKTVKKELEGAKDNKDLKETIIRRYLKSETDWLEEELKEIDKATIKYTAKLIGLQDAFEKAQSINVEEVEKIYKVATDTLKKIDATAGYVKTNIQQTTDNLNSMLKRIGEIDFYKIERLLEIINKINNMSTAELDILKKVINS